MQLVVANINADHPRSACLQQAIGKAASGHPHVQRPPALHIQAHFSQRAGQLQATARDKAVIGVWFDIQFDIVIQLGTGLAYPVALVCRAMIDPPCVNQMLRGSARRTASPRLTSKTSARGMLCRSENYSLLYPRPDPTGCLERLTKLSATRLARRTTADSTVSNNARRVLLAKAAHARARMGAENRQNTRVGHMAKALENQAKHWSMLRIFTQVGHAVWE